MSASVRRYQQRLKELDFDPGPIDGIRGALTIAAVRAFQRSRRLVVDGIVGPKTYAALFAYGQAERKEMAGAPSHLSPDAYAWVDEAKRWIGAHESRDNTRIWNSIKLWLSEKWNPDDTPWCGAFMGIVFRSTMPDEPIPSNPWGARNWLKFGRPCKAQFGAVVVLWRGKRSGWSGHVGLVTGVDLRRGRIRILGGNQKDMVREDWFSMDRVLDYRWPTTALDGVEEIEDIDSAGAELSTNEE